MKFIKLTHLLILMLLFFVNSIFAMEDYSEQQKTLKRKIGQEEREPSNKRIKITKSEPEPAASSYNLMVEEEHKLPQQMSDQSFNDPQSTCLETPEMLEFLLSFVVGERDPHFIAVSKMFYETGMGIYNRLNKKCGHNQWAGGCLNPRTLYVFNSRYITYLGLYNNLHQGWALKVDRKKFECLYDTIKASPAVSTKSVCLQYANVLRLFIGCKDPTPYQQPFMRSLLYMRDRKTATCAVALSHYISQEGIRGQTDLLNPNEVALYIHFVKYVVTIDPTALYNMELEAPLFDNGTQKSSFFPCIDESLRTLKTTAMNSPLDVTTEEWFTLFSQDPSLTSSIGLNAIERFKKEKRYDYLAQYYDKVSHISKFEKGYKPDEELIFLGIKANVRLGNYEKAHMLYDKIIEIHDTLKDEYYHKANETHLKGMYYYIDFLNDHLKWGLRIYLHFRFIDKAVELADWCVQIKEEAYNHLLETFDIGCDPIAAACDPIAAACDPIAAAVANYKAGKINACAQQLERSLQFYQRAAKIWDEYYDVKNLTRKEAYRSAKSHFKAGNFSQTIKYGNLCLAADTAGNMISSKKQEKLDVMLTEAKSKTALEAKA
jgi:tetratricopeptide (TPR) repeat protein